MSKLKVAVIGCGSISTYRHIPEYAENPHVELVAFCDVKLDRAEKFTALHGGRAYTNYKEMLKHEKPDVVSVCTPKFLNAECSIDAMRAGAHVLVENPMAATVK